jgi:hypothetical protein
MIWLCIANFWLWLELTFWPMWQVYGNAVFLWEYKRVCIDPSLIYFWKIYIALVLSICDDPPCLWLLPYRSCWLILFSQLGRWATINDLVILSCLFWTPSRYVIRHRLGHYVFDLDLWSICVVGIWLYFLLMQKFGSMLFDTFDCVVLKLFIYLSYWLDICH